MNYYTNSQNHHYNQNINLNIYLLRNMIHFLDALIYAMLSFTINYVVLI